MGIYYNPPQPPTANSGGTPPEPHAPIGNQGSQPPRYSSVLMLAAVLASWPADLEPRLQRPNNQQQNIAPLTLPSGQQPPQFSIAARMASAVSAWPLDLEPRLERPNNVRPSTAPLTLVYGSPPPPRPILPSLIARLAGAWDAPSTAQRAPLGLAWDVVVASVVPYTPPPSLIWSAWADSASSLVRPVVIAPLALPIGDRPPRPVLPSLLARLVGAWDQPCDAQTAPKTAGWNVPVVATVPASTPPWLILRAWQDEPIRVPRPVSIAPLTLVYGNTPPVQAPLNRSIRVAINAWPADLEPRLMPPNAERVHVAPLTLVYGQAPPVRRGLSIPQTTVVAAWIPAVEPQKLRWFVVPDTVVSPTFTGKVYLVSSHRRGFSVPGHDRAFTTTTHGRTHSVPSHDRLFSVRNRKRNV